MSFLTTLKTIGKDLSHVGVWIEDGLKLVAPEISLFDPPLGVIFTGVESFIENLQTQVPLTATQVQTIVTEITALVAKLQPAKAPTPPVT